MYSEEEPQRQMSIPPSFVALDNLKHPPVIVFTSLTFWKGSRKETKIPHFTQFLSKSEITENDFHNLQ